VLEARLALRLGRHTEVTPQVAIEAQDLRRTYRTSTGTFLRRRRLEVEAVRGISFSVPRGRIFGIVGPNGAGKTTTIKMLTTLLQPTSGWARVQGFDVVRDRQEVRRRIGYVVGGERGLYDRLSGYDNLRYFAVLYGVPGEEQRRRIESVLELVGLQGRETERVEGYSRGMRQRLHVARGLLHDPPVLFLDEPTVGVDPVGARDIRRTVAALAAAGKTVLLTTHSMVEAETLCDRIAVIARGRVVAAGSAAAIKDSGKARAVTEILAGDVSDATLRRLRALPGVLAVSTEPRDLAWLIRVQSAASADLTPAILEQLNGARILNLSSRQPTLEDAYIELVSDARQVEPN
jgi:ABC-2 type transport system ATP-binding protein